MNTLLSVKEQKAVGKLRLSILAFFKTTDSKELGVLWGQEQGVSAPFLDITDDSSFCKAGSCK